MTIGGATNLFPRRGELLASYDFSDIAAGLGFETFWGTPNVDTGETKYNLLPFVVTSGNNKTSTNRSGEGTTTINFDSSTFNLPRTAKGIAYISLGETQGSANAVSIKAQMAVMHADLSVTNISSEFESVQNANTTGIVVQLFALPLTQTTIKKGEKLRMIIKIVIDATGGSGVLQHDNTDSDIDEHLKLFMPFRIDI